MAFNKLACFFNPERVAPLVTATCRAVVPDEGDA